MRPTGIHPRATESDPGGIQSATSPSTAGQHRSAAFAAASVARSGLPVLGAAAGLAVLCSQRHHELVAAKFRRNEAGWQRALNRAEIFALLNLGLAPFIYFANRMPNEIYYRQMNWAMGVAAVLYIFNLNRSLRQLAVMLPDQTLREDTELFTSMNQGLMVTLIALVGMYFGLHHVDELPLPVIQFIVVLEEHRRWLLIFLVLLPVAMTMSLLWKIKEIVLNGIFGRYH